MKKNSKFPFVIILIGAILMAACSQAGAPAASTSAPAANTSAPAVASPAPTATASPEPIVATPPALTFADCTLLSMDDIGMVLGEAVVDAREEIDPVMKGVQNRNTYCFYLTNNVQLELTFIDPTGFPGASDGVMQGTRGAYPDAVTIPGLGDDAIIHDFHGYIELFFRKADSVNSIGLAKVGSLISPDNAQAVEKAVAELLLSHLP